jgi:hypothetical protein
MLLTAFYCKGGIKKTCIAIMDNEEDEDISPTSGVS